MCLLHLNPQILLLNEEEEEKYSESTDKRQCSRRRKPVHAAQSCWPGAQHPSLSVRGIFSDSNHSVHGELRNPLVSVCAWAAARSRDIDR